MKLHQPMPGMRWLLVLGLTASAVFQTRAAALFYEGFDYTASALLAPLNDTTGSPNPGQLNIASGYNWRYTGAGGAANTPPAVANSGLSYPNLLAATGNSALFDATQLGATRIQFASAAISSGTVFWSGLLQVGSVANLNAVNGMFLGAFNNTAGAAAAPPTSGNALLRIRQDSGDTSMYNLGAALTTSTAAGVIQWSGAYSALQTVFVVASYEFVAGANNDIARMWINPAPGTFGALTSPAADLTSQPGGSIADATSVFTFQLRNVNTVGTPTGVLFDELRVGTSWADVTPAVPEPSVAMLIGVGLVALVGWQRFRIR